MNVGDSRLYIIREDKIEQITSDHSLVQEMINIGELDEESAKKHKNKNVINESNRCRSADRSGLFFLEVGRERCFAIVLRWSDKYDG
jgi:protein phosphatase